MDFIGHDIPLCLRNIYNVEHTGEKLLVLTKDYKPWIKLAKKQAANQDNNIISVI